jgi:erythromycin esterase
MSAPGREAIAQEELDEVAALLRPLAGTADLDPLLDRVGDARVVMLGEASHGTAEYYRWRAAATRRLVEELGFSFVAVEGDWPDCFAVNRWVKGRATQDRTVRQVLGDFERWPTWMWANDEVAAFVDWLREHNQRSGDRVGFYGLDVYSLWESLHRVVEYVREHHPDVLPDALRAYRCFEPYAEDPQRYAWATRMVPESCEDEVVELLLSTEQPVSPGDDPESDFDAHQNARVLADAERYYRTMVRADGSSWNVRDCHMADTLDRLLTHHGTEAKAVVWAHNTHVGDARATDMAAAGMVNIGQLARERLGDDHVVLVGFGGHHGHVIASDGWGAPHQRMRVPPAPGGTHEDLLHQVSDQPGLLVFGERRDTPWLAARHGHRAIGVVYDPGAERRGNWVPTVMGRRYDAFCWFDATDSLHPLHREPVGAGERDTFPWST